MGEEVRGAAARGAELDEEVGLEAPHHVRDDEGVVRRLLHRDPEPRNSAEELQRLPSSQGGHGLLGGGAAVSKVSRVAGCAGHLKDSLVAKDDVVDGHDLAVDAHLLELVGHSRLAVHAHLGRLASQSPTKSERHLVSFAPPVTHTHTHFYFYCRPPPPSICHPRTKPPDQSFPILRT